MKSITLRLNLLLVGGVLALMLMQSAGFQWLPRAVFEDYVIQRLEHDADTLYARLRLAPQPVEYIEPSPGTVYDAPLSGYYFQIEHAGGTIRSRSLWDTTLPSPAKPAPSLERLPGPRGQRLLVLGREYRVDGEPVTIRVAEDVSDMERAVDQFQWGLLGTSLLTLLVVLGLQLLTLRRALRPLRAAEQICREIEAGRGEPHPVDAPDELAPLIRSLNRLAYHHGQRQARTRRALANLSHALKTPLAILAQRAEALTRQGRDQEGHAIRTQVEIMQQTVDRELQRARLAGAGQLGSRFDARQELAALQEALEKLYPKLRIDLQIQGESVALDGDDMLELFGNLVDNACKWAQSRVVVQVNQTSDYLTGVIEDDGPGVPDSQRTQLMKPGWRADENRPGHGMGLVIVGDIIGQYHGSIEFDCSGLGGLRVSLRIPLGTLPDS
ncbi:MAG: ATP-binding protein [Halothiobacillaceae bacterium]